MLGFLLPTVALMITSKSFRHSIFEVAAPRTRSFPLLSLHIRNPNSSVGFRRSAQKNSFCARAVLDIKRASSIDFELDSSMQGTITDFGPDRKTKGLVGTSFCDLALRFKFIWETDLLGVLSEASAQNGLDRIRIRAAMNLIKWPPIERTTVLNNEWKVRSIMCAKKIIIKFGNLCYPIPV